MDEAQQGAAYQAQAVIATAASMAEPIHSTEAVFNNVMLTHLDEHLHGFPCSYALSPNPADEYVDIEFADCHVPEVELELVDLNGKILRQQLVQVQLKTRLSTQGLPAGIYWVRVKAKGHASARKLVVE